MHFAHLTKPLSGNSARTRSQGLGMTVVGSVPIIPTKVIRRLGSPADRHQQWYQRLIESVDGIAARLLRGCAAADQRLKRSKHGIQIQQPLLDPLQPLFLA